MNDDTTINRTSIKHAYQQVADAITTRITTGHLLNDTQDSDGPAFWMQMGIVR